MSEEPNAYMMPGGGAHERGRAGDILLIDDDPDIVEMLVTLLHDEEELPVRTAHSVAAALADPNPRPPALILLDLSLPGEDVAEALPQLRLRPDWRDVPVVVCSGREDIVSTAESLGAADYLRKPFDLDALLAVADQYARI